MMFAGTILRVMLSSSCLLLCVAEEIAPAAMMRMECRLFTFTCASSGVIDALTMANPLAEGEKFS
jgi:hypothetical protein